MIWFPFGFWNASAMIFALGETTHLEGGATKNAVSAWMATKIGFFLPETTEERRFPSIGSNYVSHLL
jgi:hypothetical protein